ncbi:hypothetical protein [Edaphosphingomonas haloaromaticamans]|uniref:Uncharacterized protein n=1 Tax=Edaphosphingomonas haloaromaticamans TaxID=653954 RepID=A0A1S1HFE4_9SPHN|nr:MULTISPECIES: hypothetical protein [Sphingomonas]MDX3884035.1 hypothetical protein [Sphingomonas sp.]OHT19913.1 hypothetical protein BHE75_01906 [Sphingomonas haloaromaticamans]
MLALLVAAGVVPEQSNPTTGPVDVPAERLAVAAKIQTGLNIAVGIPLGAVAWQQPFDPADHLPFGISFTELLASDESIVAIERIGLSSAGAALGVIIDQSADRSPIIDEAGGRRIQLWFSVDPGFQASPTFDAAGVKVPVTCRVLTSKGLRFERTAILSVRQL